MPGLEVRILRPLNYGSVPGHGWGTFHAADGTEVAVVNAQGRSTMIPIDNPFTEMDELLDGGADTLPPVRLVDFHCELTSEKTAFGLHLDGRVSAFAVGAGLTPDMGVLHFEKAFTWIKGLYQYVDQLCARTLFSGYPYINKESDMGVPGLQRAKRSYHPLMQVASYALRRK